MPNTPMMVGVGLWVFTILNHYSSRRRTITGVFALSAKVVEVESETDLDTVTAGV